MLIQLLNSEDFSSQDIHTQVLRSNVAAVMKTDSPNNERRLHQRAERGLFHNAASAGGHASVS